MVRDKGCCGIFNHDSNLMPDCFTGDVKDGMQSVAAGLPVDRSL